MEVVRMFNKCPFCGSDKIKKETPYVDKFGEKIESYCCLSQKRNAVYAEKRYSHDNKPDPTEVSKW